MGSDTFTTLGKYLEDGRDLGTPRKFRWGVLGVILTLVAGAFTLGFKMSSTVSQAEADRLRLDIQKLQEEQEKLRREFTVSNKKEAFRTLSCRIKKGREALARTPTSKDLGLQVKADEQALAAFIVANVDQEKDVNGIPVMRVVKRDTVAESVVKFEGDNTAYIVPQEVKKLTPVGTFYTADPEALQTLKVTAIGCGRWEAVRSGSRNVQTRPLNIDIAKIR